MKLNSLVQVIEPRTAKNRGKLGIVRGYINNDKDLDYNLDREMKSKGRLKVIFIDKQLVIGKGYFEPERLKLIAEDFDPSVIDLLRL
jgi:hypothetical protein